MVEVPKISVDVYLPETTDLWVNLATLLPASPVKSFEHKTLDVQTINSPRAHGYRVALPRSSTSDSFLSL